ncbi:MAG: hypothetical protein WDO13_00720 [Verrucomicrobiota bacterium]
MQPRHLLQRHALLQLDIFGQRQRQRSGDLKEIGSQRTRFPRPPSTSIWIVRVRLSNVAGVTADADAVPSNSTKRTDSTPWAAQPAKARDAPSARASGFIAKPPASAPHRIARDLRVAGEQPCLVVFFQDDAALRRRQNLKMAFAPVQRQTEFVTAVTEDTNRLAVPLEKNDDRLIASELRRLRDGKIDLAVVFDDRVDLARKKAPASAGGFFDPRRHSRWAPETANKPARPTHRPAQSRALRGPFQNHSAGAAAVAASLGRGPERLDDALVRAPRVKPPVSSGSTVAVSVLRRSRGLSFFRLEQFLERPFGAKNPPGQRRLRAAHDPGRLAVIHLLEVDQRDGLAPVRGNRASAA